MTFERQLKNFKSQDIENKKEAIIFFGETKEKLSVDYLIEDLKKERDLRPDIIWALGKIGDSKAIPHLLDYLGSEDWQERGLSAEALGEIKGSHSIVVEALIALLNDTQLNDTHDTVHWQVTWALGEIGDKSAVDPLLKVLKEKDYRKCWHAVWALGKIGDKKAVSHIVSLLKTRKEKIIHRYVAIALNDLKDSTTLDVLKKCMEDTDGEVRYFAKEAVRNIEMMLAESNDQ